MDIKLPDSTLRKYLDTKATPDKIAEALTLCGPSVDRLHKLDNDYVYEVEAITNRVDTASAFGFAREASAILPLFGIPAKLINSPYDIKSSDLPERSSPKLPLEIETTDKTLVTALCAIVLDNLTCTDSPSEIVDQLTLSGVRAQNNLIDITNYLTLCFGQPVHIFDYDKIGGHKLILRNSRPGEKLQTLDDKIHTLRGEDIIIEDGDGRLIDLCGIMGGKLSEVDQNTTRAVLFVQTYHPKKIRRTSLYTQQRTLAAQIFEKNPDSKLVIPTLIEGVRLLTKYAKAKVAGESINMLFDKSDAKILSLSVKWLSNLVGHKFDYKTVSSILKNLGFKTSKINSDILQVTVPSWRQHDISIPEDLAEEVARVHGYFRLEGKLPAGELQKETPDPLLSWEYKAKVYLSHIGFSEIFNYSLVSGQLCKRASIDPDHSVTLTNPLTADFELMRRSLIPSLLMDLENNQGKINLPIRIFELSNIYLSSDHEDNQLPQERSILALATQGIGYRDSKGYLEALFKELHLRNISFIKQDDQGGPWLQSQTAQIYSDDKFIGIFGGIKTDVKSSFGLSGDVFLANLDFQSISDLANTNHTYSPISSYPDFIEDITITSDNGIAELIQSIKLQSSLISQVIYLDSFKNNHTFTIHLNNREGNLTQAEVDKIKYQLLSAISSR